MKNAPIRVLIADGDPLVGRALARLLRNSAGLEVIATSARGDEVLELAGRLHPAVTLVDAHTAQMDGMKLTKGLCEQIPATRVIILGVYATMRDQALMAGACRFLLKDCSRDTLAEAIRLAASEECEANENDQQSHRGQRAGASIPALRYTSGDKWSGGPDSGNRGHAKIQSL